MKTLLSLDHAEDCEIPHKGYQINNKEREGNPDMESFQPWDTQQKEDRGI